MAHEATAFREKAISSSRRAPAAPESIAIAGERRGPRRGRRRGRRPRSRPPRSAAPRRGGAPSVTSPSTTFRSSRAFVSGSAPRSPRGSQRSMPRSSGSSSYSEHGAAGDLADEVRARRRELVDPAGAVHDERAPRVELHERVGDRARELGRVDAEHLGARAGRVRQRAEDVEHRPRRQLAPHRPRVLHRRMVRLGEEEAEAELVDRLARSAPAAARARSRAPRGRRPRRSPTRPRGSRASRPPRRPPPRRAPPPSRCSRCSRRRRPCPPCRRGRRASAAPATTCSRIASAHPAISSAVSPFSRSATRKPPIWACVASPAMIEFITSRASLAREVVPVEQPRERRLDHVPSRKFRRQSSAAPERREHRLRMELHAVDAKLAVAHRHHLAVGGGGRHLEDVRHRGRRERVVAARRESLRQAREDARARRGSTAVALPWTSARACPISPPNAATIA